ncbi:hypothetical protein D9M69_302920 [compost metagenome]
MPEGGPAFVHHLGLALRVEVLGDLAHDAHHFPLPGLQQRGVLLEEVEDVLLGFHREALVVLVATFAAALGNGAPEVVDLFLQVFFAVLLPAPFLLGGDGVGAFVAVDAVVHQGMAGVQQVLHRVDAVALLALVDVLLGEYQVVDDGAGVGPGAEQVVALEEAVVAVAGMGDHQGLHGDGVFLHQVGDAGVGIDDDLVGQAHLAAGVAFLGGEEVLAVGPVMVAERHPHRGVGIHHLLGADHFDLVRIGVQRIALGNPADLAVVGADQVEGPFGPRGNRFAFLLAGSHVTPPLRSPAGAGRARGTPGRYPPPRRSVAGRRYRRTPRRPVRTRTRVPGVRAG